MQHRTPDRIKMSSERSVHQKCVWEEHNEMNYFIMTADGVKTVEAGKTQICNSRKINNGHHSRQYYNPTSIHDSKILKFKYYGKIPYLCRI